VRRARVPPSLPRWARLKCSCGSLGRRTIPSSRATTKNAQCLEAARACPLRGVLVLPAPPEFETGAMRTTPGLPRGAVGSSRTGQRDQYCSVENLLSKRESGCGGRWAGEAARGAAGGEDGDDLVAALLRRDRGDVGRIPCRAQAGSFPGCCPGLTGLHLREYRNCREHGRSVRRPIRAPAAPAETGRWKSTRSDTRTRHPAMSACQRLRPSVGGCCSAAPHARGGHAHRTPG